MRGMPVTTQNCMPRRARRTSAARPRALETSWSRGSGARDDVRVERVVLEVVPDHDGEPGVPHHPLGELDAPHRARGRRRPGPARPSCSAASRRRRGSCAHGRATLSSRLLDALMSTMRNVPSGRRAARIVGEHGGREGLVVDRVEGRHEVVGLTGQGAATSRTSNDTFVRPHSVASARATVSASALRSKPANRLPGNALPRRLTACPSPQPMSMTSMPSSRRWTQTGQRDDDVDERGVVDRCALLRLQVVEARVVVVDRGRLRGGSARAPSGRPGP